ncbi:MAG TPA: hypothetical protein VGL56_17465 [Fimbriimonadaceae bacterium]|jgi:hypothetical protein
MKYSTFCVAALTLALPCALQAQSYPPAWSSTAHYANGDLVTYTGNYYRAIATIPGSTKLPTADYPHWELYNARVSTTIPIGVDQAFPDLATAWKYTQNAQVGYSGAIHFTILTTNGNFSETFTAPFSLDHPFGANMSIVGDHAANITLEFPSTYGIYIDSNHSFAELANVTIDTTTSSDSLVALSANFNGAINEVTGVNFTGGWAVDVATNVGGLLRFTGTVDWTNATDRFLDAESGGQIYLPVNSVLTASTGYRYGLFARSGGKIFLGAGSSINGVSGGGDGAYATDGGYLMLNGVSFFNNSTDIDVEDGSTAHAKNATSNPPTIGMGSFVFTD